MLFQRRFHPGLRDGSIDVTFRAWTSPRVKVGGRYRFGRTGLLEVRAIERVDSRSITEPEARRAGFEDRASLLRELKVSARRSTRLYRVAFAYLGEEEPPDLATSSELRDAELHQLAARLDRMDRLSRHGPWTRKTLALVAAHPRRPAAELAERLGRDRLPFKADVRKLKRLGLTISHEVGYELSPRGRRFLEVESVERPEGRG